MARDEKDCADTRWEAVVSNRFARNPVACVCGVSTILYVTGHAAIWDLVRMCCLRPLWRGRLTTMYVVERVVCFFQLLLASAGKVEIWAMEIRVRV